MKRRLWLAGLGMIGLSTVLGAALWLLAWPATGLAQDAPAPVSELPKLPVVATPAPAQPLVGLEEDVHLNKTPPRATKGLDLVKMGWTYDCMDCHKLLQARWTYDRPLTEHRDVELRHGNNRFCLNCHHPTNRNAFVDYDGSEIAQQDVVMLCAKCHGPTYRDWEAGAHGRRNGYWDTGRGMQTRLRCIQCHDPHFPKYQILTPLPPASYPLRAAGREARTGPALHP